MLRFPSPRWRVRCARILIGLALFAGISAELAAAGDLQSAVADARAAALTDNYAEAFSKGITALEAYPESKWDRATLRRFVTQVAGRWFPRLSAAEKQSAIQLLAEPKSPGAKWAKAYALWKLKQRFQALTLLMPLIAQHPDSIGAEFAIQGLLIAQWATLGEAGASAGVKAVANAAPNNPATGWALCRLTWRFTYNRKLDRARAVLAEIIAAKPETLAATVAGKLTGMLNAIESGDYARAFQVLSDHRDYLRTGTPAGLVIDAFLTGIDWKNPDAHAGRIETLQQVFGAIAEADGDGERRSFAIAVLARILEKQGKKTEAADQWQRIVNSGVEILEPHALGQIGKLTAMSDPERAIAALEKQRAIEEPSTIATREEAMMLLGRLYIGKQDYAKGEELYRWLVEQEQAGEFLIEGPPVGEELKARLACCLFGQGKDEEGHAVIDPVLAKYRYGTKLAALKPEELRNLAILLRSVGGEAESRAHFEELSKRSK